MDRVKDWFLGTPGRERIVCQWRIACQVRRGACRASDAWQRSARAGPGLHGWHGESYAKANGEWPWGSIVHVQTQAEMGSAL